ncbi:MAG: hypothetical protein M3041_10990 [Acidobacteriota bacterium]|nr:hypothetical protein [Acidobacteriota bacterium]
MARRITLYVLAGLAALIFISVGPSLCACDDSGGIDEHYTFAGMAEGFFGSKTAPAEITRYADSRLQLHRVDVEGIVQDPGGHLLGGVTIRAGRPEQADSDISARMLYLHGGDAATSWQHGEGQNPEYDGKFRLKVEAGHGLLVASKPGYETHGGTYEAPLPRGQHLIVTLTPTSVPRQGM